MFLFPLIVLAFGAFAYVARDRASSPVHVGAPPPRALPAPARREWHAERDRDDRRDDRRDDWRRDRILERERFYGGRPAIYAEMAAPACPPSPMAVLSQMITEGREPPPFVVQCAIAEAELLGRYDVAYGLTQQYVLPALQGGAPASGPGPVPPPGGNAPDAVPAQAPTADPGTGSGPDPAADQDLGAPPDAASPVSGVPDAAWSAMLARLVREPAAFESGKHVGRYRHHKARLGEIGFDAAVIGNDPRLQDLAMSTDLADCFRHLHASGSLDQCVGMSVTLPGHPGAVQATLSGVLGVCSVAGLEGAINWCERASDREKYPHTTMAFLRTNGVF